MQTETSKVSKTLKAQSARSARKVSRGHKAPLVLPEPLARRARQALVVSRGRSPSGSVLPVAAARVVLPAALQGLDRQRMIAAIKSAPLGRVDRKIALLRYVERLPLPDIAAQTHYSRTAIGYRLKGITKIFE